jgi:hypothetical protein
VTPASSVAAPSEKTSLAVLPIDDDRLFRAERAQLRSLLALEIARRAPEYKVLPIAEVAAKLRPQSATTGTRCAFDGSPLQRLAEDVGWRSTRVYHVAGTAGSRQELWVELSGGAFGAPGVTFAAPWNPRLEPFGRYAAAFASLQRLPEPGGLVGGLAASGSNSNLAKAGPISVCEEKSFGACQQESTAWLDRAKELAACHRDADDVQDELLVDSSATPARCEIVGLDDPASPAGKREACSCAAAVSSAGVRAKPGRRVIRVRYEAPELAGKPRPELRVLDATTNLHADEGWHAVRSPGPPPSSRPVHRLEVDNLDGFAAPLARCAVAPGSTLVAELEVEDHGAVRAARVRSEGVKREVAACVEKALKRGGLACTRDGKPAEVRLAMTWPTASR